MGYGRRPTEAAASGPTVKRRTADRSKWDRVLAHRYAGVYAQEPDFEGHVALLTLERVREPLIVTLGGKQYRLADAGYSWLTHFPTGRNYTVTTVFDAEGEVVEWYIDVCAATGVDERGVPWFDDLYLDVVVLPGGEIFLLDEDELEDALRQGAITREQYDLAWTEARRLIAAVEAGELPLLAQTPQHARRYFGETDQ
jgi:predicted RNA-binding protein associated with RNAse of E/G family